MNQLVGAVCRRRWIAVENFERLRASTIETFIFEQVCPWILSPPSNVESDTIAATRNADSGGNSRADSILISSHRQFSSFRETIDSSLPLTTTVQTSDADLPEIQEYTPEERPSIPSYARRCPTNSSKSLP